jgi:hypothetical protein
MAASVVLFWTEGTLYTRAGQAYDRDITLTDAAMLAGELSDQGPDHVVIRRGLP